MAKKTEEKAEPIYFSTGITLLDLVTGGGKTIGFGMGYQAGTIARDWGNSSSSKSFKAVEMLASNYYKYKDKFKWVYDDVELGNTIDTESIYGVELIPRDFNERTASKTVEEWAYNVNKFLDSLKPDECGIYVMDSLDAVSNKDTEDRKDERNKAFEKGKEFDSGTYSMSAQKFMSQEFFRGLSAKLAQKNAMLYLVSQERDNVGAGMYAAKNRLGGGRAVQFYESVRIYSKKKQTIEKNKKAIGVVVGIEAQKTRHPRPFRECLVPIMFTTGADNTGANIDFLFELRSDKTGELLKKADAITWAEGMEPMDRDTLIQYVEENRLRGELIRKVIAKWEEEEAAIVVTRRPKYEDDE